MFTVVLYQTPWQWFSPGSGGAVLVILLISPFQVAGKKMVLGCGFVERCLLHPPKQCLALLLQEHHQCLHRKGLPWHTTQGFSMHKGICLNVTELFDEFAVPRLMGWNEPVVPAAGYCDEGKNTTKCRLTFFFSFSVFSMWPFNLELWTWSVVSVLLQPLNSFVKVPNFHEDCQSTCFEKKDS